MPRSSLVLWILFIQASVRIRVDAMTICRDLGPYRPRNGVAGLISKQVKTIMLSQNPSCYPGPRISAPPRLATAPAESSNSLAVQAQKVFSELRNDLTLFHPPNRSRQLLSENPDPHSIVLGKQRNARSEIVRQEHWRHWLVASYMRLPFETRQRGYNNFWPAIGQIVLTLCGRRNSETSLPHHIQTFGGHLTQIFGRVRWPAN